MRVDEREITSEVALCGSDGRLNPAAVGWTRRPLHDTSPTHPVGVTAPSLDYVGVHGVWVHDRHTGETVSHDAIDPLGRGATLPGRLGDGAARARTRALSIEVVAVPGGRSASTSSRI